MRIESVKYPYYKPTNFQGKKIDILTEKMSIRNHWNKPESLEFRALRNIYNNLWEKLSLPKNLKPRLQYKSMLVEMGFSPEHYTIFVQKSLAPFTMDVRNKSGKNQAILRHEIEHVIQFWDVIRLLGAENTAKEFSERNKGINFKIKPSLLKKMKEIEQTLGRISPESEDCKNAQLYLNAMRNYPEMNRYYGLLSIEEIKDFINYRNNILEKNARIAAKKYEPSVLKKIKVSIEEFLKLLLK